jgi:hypothetical protein
MTLNDKETRIVALTKRLVMMKVEQLPGHPFGHAYLWGNISFNRRLKNKKLKLICVRVLLGGICVADLNKAVELASSVDGVSGVYYNLD